MIQRGIASAAFAHSMRTVPALVVAMSVFAACAADTDDTAGISISASTTGCDPSYACLTLDASRAQHVISPLLFGDNIEWMHGGNGLWDAATGLRPQLAGPISQLGVRLLRYPGGTPSDFFDWSGAVGPVASRRPQVDPFQSSDAGLVTELPTFGPDEFAATAGALHSEMLITVNVGTGTSTLAAAWLAHYKAIGVKAKYWEIGNEVYFGCGDWTSCIQTKNPWQYAAMFDDYARRLRAIDPTVKIGVLGCDDCFYNLWDALVLTSIHERADFISVHNSYAPVIATRYDANQDAAVYAATLNSAATIRFRMDKTLQTLAMYGGQNASIPLAVTEHAAYFVPVAPFDDNAQAQLRRNRTLASALGSATTFQLFMADPRITIANHFNLDSPLWQAALTTDLDGFSNPVASAFAFVFRMYSDAAGGRYIPVTLTGSPTVSSPQIGAMAAVTLPALDTVAVRMPDRVMVYVVNRDPARDVPVHLSIAGRYVTAVHVDVVDGAEQGAANSSATPNAVTMIAGDFPGSNQLDTLIPAHSLVRLTLR